MCQCPSQYVGNVLKMSKIHVSYGTSLPVLDRKV